MDSFICAITFYCLNINPGLVKEVTINYDEIAVIDKVPKFYCFKNKLTKVTEMKPNKTTFLLL